MVTYVQITTQLGNVLDFEYPVSFQNIMDAIKNLIQPW
jgi:hypothetical protein